MRLGWFTISLGLLLSLQISSLGSTNEAVNLTEKERDWVAQQGPLRVGITPEWAPFSYFTAEGGPTGIDVDILKLISKRTGLRFEIQHTSSWAETLELAKEGRLDLVSGVTLTPEREKIFEFTKPYYTGAVVIISREKDYRFSDIAQLHHAVLAMPRKHVTTQALMERVPSAQLILADNLPDCFKLVAEGKADAVVGNLFTASRYLNDHPRDKLSISGVIPEFGFPLRFGVKRDHHLLTEILNKALDSISPSEMDEITSRHIWFGLQGTQRGELLRKRIMQIVAGALLLILLLGGWVFILHKRVQARRAAEEELQRINRSLEIFSHSISHDLRAPVRAISGFAEVLKQDCGEKLGEEGNVYLDRISTAAERMNVLIRDILAYSHASRGAFSISMMSLQNVVEQLIGEFPAEQRGYFEIVNPLPEVPANPTLLSQCLANLLSNAIKFIPKERTPKIRILAESEGNFVKVWVEDNGIGIAPENQKRIFEVFERVQTQGYEGTGIGLAIVTKAIERMGGSVGVESDLGKGSRFWIQLPATNPKLARS